LLELTIEEWIEWMEEKKKAGMTPEQASELQRRKMAWAENQKKKEEKRKQEEEKQIEKTRQKMAAELRSRLHSVLFIALLHKYYLKFLKLFRHFLFFLQGFPSG